MLLRNWIKAYQVTPTHIKPIESVTSILCVVNVLKHDKCGALRVAFWPLLASVEITREKCMHTRRFAHSMMHVHAYLTNRAILAENIVHLV